MQHLPTALARQEGTELSLPENNTSQQAPSVLHTASRNSQLSLYSFHRIVSSDEHPLTGHVHSCFM